MYGLDNLHTIPVIGFAVASLIYFSLELNGTDTFYKVATIGGNLCLFPLLVYISFKSMRLWMNQVGLYAFIPVFATLGFAFSLYSLYYFSRKLYADKDATQQKVILDGCGVAGSLATVLLLLPGAPMNMLYALSIPVWMVYLWYLRIVRAFKKK
jgi:hypothetical protein